MLKRLLLAAAVLAATTVSARAQVHVCSAFGQSCVSPGTTCSAAVESPTTTICSATVTSSTSTTPSSLLTGLVHYWTLDEQSGTRNDSVGSAHLTDNNTVGYSSGKNGNAASFVGANSESLSSNTLAVPAVEADFTASLWFYMNSSVGGQALLTQWGTIGSNTGLFSLGYYMTTPGALDLYVWDAAYKNASVAVTTSAWHLAVIWYSTTDKKFYLSVDNGTPASIAVAGINTLATYGIRIGSESGQRYSNSNIDEVGIWNRVLTAQERATLYNSGAGKFYPSF